MRKEFALLLVASLLVFGCIGGQQSVAAPTPTQSAPILVPTSTPALEPTVAPTAQAVDYSELDEQFQDIEALLSDFDDLEMDADDLDFDVS